MATTKTTQTPEEKAEQKAQDKRNKYNAILVQLTHQTNTFRTQMGKVTKSPWNDTEKAEKIIALARTFRRKSHGYANTVAKIFLTIAGESVAEDMDTLAPIRGVQFQEGVVMVFTKRDGSRTATYLDYPLNKPLMFMYNNLFMYKSGQRMGHGAAINNEDIINSAGARPATQEEVDLFFKELVATADSDQLQAVMDKNGRSLYHALPRL